MRGKKMYRKLLSYGLAIILLSTLMVFPSYAHGRNNTISKTAMKTSQGLYLCAEDGGGSTLVGNRQNIGDWEAFEILDLGLGYIAIKSHNGKYIGA